MKLVGKSKEKGMMARGQGTSSAAVMQEHVETQLRVKLGYAFPLVSEGNSKLPFILLLGSSACTEGHLSGSSQYLSDFFSFSYSLSALFFFSNGRDNSWLSVYAGQQQIQLTFF